MGKLLRALLALSALSGSLCVLSCSDKLPATQVLVVVNSDLQLGAQLSALEVELQSADGSQPTPDRRRFELSSGEAEGKFPLPLSFGVVRPDDGAERVRVVLRGLGPLGLDGREVVVIEQKAIVTFHSRVTQRLTLFLGRVCFQNLCAGGVDQTCYASAHDELRAGQCGPVPEPPLSPVRPRRELDGVAGPASSEASGFDATDASFVADAGQDAALAARPITDVVGSDAGPVDIFRDADADATPPTAGPPLADRCASDNGGCGDPAHWTCRGQGAAAPICDDLDECASANGGCERVCRNGRGTYSCECPAPDVLELDAKRCRPRRWGTASEIDPDRPGHANGVEVAVDGAGNAIAVWAQHDGTRDNIWADRFAVGSGWGGATLLETGDDFAYSPQVVADEVGNAIAVWEQSDGTRNNIWANRFAIGSGWGAPTRIDSDAGDARAPAVAVDRAGNAIAVWQQGPDVTREDIWANRFVLGSGWEAATRIESEDAGDAYLARVATDGAGNAIAIWQQSDGTRNIIRANHFVVGSGWAGATRIGGDGDGFNSQLAVDVLGNAVAVWAQFDDSKLHVWANRFVVGSGWATALRLDVANGDTSVSEPVVAVDGLGDATAAWYQSDGLWVKRFVVGSGWGTAVRIPTGGTDGTRPQVAADVLGNTVVVWTQKTGTNWQNVWATRFGVASGWGAVTRIQTDSTDHIALQPEVAMDRSGGAIAVWTQQSDRSGEFTVRVNRFE